MQTTNAVVASSADQESNSAVLSLSKDHLVAWYTFNNGSLKDSSPCHNDIVLNNEATPVADRNGRKASAYRFNGTCSYMRVKNSASLNPTCEITLFAIVKVADFYAGQCHGNRILDKAADDFANGNYYLGFDDSYHTDGMNCSQPVEKGQENFNALYGYAGINRNAYAYDTGYVHPGKWYRFAFTYANGISKLYVNGRMLTYNYGPAVFSDNGQDLYIGRNNSSQYAYWFNGIIDELAIYNKALSGKEISAFSKL